MLMRPASCPLFRIEASVYGDTASGKRVRMENSFIYL